MSFRTARYVSLFIIMLTLACVSLVPSLMVHKISSYEDRMVRCLEEMQMAIHIKQKFEQAALQLDRFYINKADSIKPAVSHLESAIDMAYVLEATLNPDKDKDKIEKLREVVPKAERLKQAMINFLKKNDHYPTADSFAGIKRITVEFKTLAALVFSSYMNLIHNDTLDAQNHIQRLILEGLTISFIGLIIGGVAGLIVTILLSHSLNRPVKLLLEGTEKLAGGDLDHVIAVNSSDEIGRLAKAFNKMSADLKRLVLKERELAGAEAKTIIEKKRSRQLADANKKLQGEIVLRKEVEEALSEREETFRLITASAQDAIIIINDETKITYWNRATETIFQRTWDEIRDRDFFDFLGTPSFRKKYHQAFEQLKQDSSGRSSNQRLEVMAVRKDGKALTLEASLAVVKLKGQWHAIGILRDISNRKLAEENLKAAKKVAEASNKAKSEFLANMSHELRTPLNHIIGFTDLVVSENFGKLNETQLDYLNDVLGSSRHLLELINDILDLSKVEAGQVDLHLTDVDVRSLLENSLVLIKEKSMKHNLTLTTRISDTPVTIKADERRLKQVLYNLLYNAVKFTPDGGAIELSSQLVTTSDKSSESAPSGIEVQAGEDAEYIIPGNGRKALEIAVADTGIGLKAEDQARVFNTFEQVEGSVSRNYEGTGLGLAVSKNLVELHGGTIRVESDGVGKGCRFAFTIPVE